jgi:hypothetical protein
MQSKKLLRGRSPVLFCVATCLQPLRRHLYQSQNMTSQVDQEANKDAISDFSQDLQNRFSKLDTEVSHALLECPLLSTNHSQIFRDVCNRLACNTIAGKKVLDTCDSSAFIWGVVYELLNFFDMKGVNIPRVREWIAKLHSIVPITITYDLFEW